MKARVEVEGELDTLRIIQQSLVEKDEGRSDAKVYLDDRKLVIEIEAKDLVALRASLNGYLRLIKVVKDIVEVLA
jgi:tRNA threonylcarbamoyladenosine modification (KEOPS) complex  Pcc1 subunit